jgi:hypothetical protein
MANVAECISKLVRSGAITRAIGDEALSMFLRSKAEYAKQMGPAGADAAAALEAAKKLREAAANKQLAIAAGVKTWRNSSGSLAMLAAVRRALSRVSNVRFTPKSGHWNTPSTLS